MTNKEREVTLRREVGLHVVRIEMEENNMQRDRWRERSYVVTVNGKELLRMTRDRQAEKVLLQTPYMQGEVVCMRPLKGMETYISHLFDIHQSRLVMPVTDVRTLLNCDVDFTNEGTDETV
jgi:hypothetical protein